MSSSDYLGISSSESARKMLTKYNRREVEEVLFSDLFTKINRKDKAQDRAFLVTNRAIYNLKPSNFGSCKRRIPLAAILDITVSEVSDEFVLHVTGEYDYRLMGPRKTECIEIMSAARGTDSGEPINVHMSTQILLKSIVVTKPMMKEKRKTGADAGAGSAAGAGAGSASDGPEPLSSEFVPPLPSVAVGAELLTITEADMEDGEDDEDEEDHEDDFAPAPRGRSTTGWAKAETDVTQESFDLLKVIGRGSFGKVMLVRKKTDGEIYAMKILRKEAIIKRNQVEHTKAERAILENISHPFLVTMRYAFQTDTKLYFVLDYMRGGELFFHLKQARRFTETRARFYCAQIALGLGHLHSNGIIYRDLKPENILMDEAGYIKLTDFGLSKATKPGDAATTFCGTPEYLAPEVIAETGHDRGVDWWSLGILLYEMLVGLPPFYSENVNTMYDLIQTAPLRFPSFLKTNTRSVLTGLICRDPESRLCAVTDIEELKAHPFFEGFDWDSLYRKEMDAPFKPDVGDASDTSNFDSEFTSEPVVDSLAPTSHLTTGGAAKFDGFTFVDRSALNSTDGEM